MTSREFTDDRGEVWQVWAIHPEGLERRIAEDPVPPPPIERRTRRETRVKVTNPLMTDGWLAFESRTERRRLAPVPDAWEALDDAALRELLGRAVATGNTQRLLA
jgi:hypothetical protein